MTQPHRRTFASLALPHYRRYALSQAVSLTGTWMQYTGQVWLVLQLTGSGTSLGLTIALQSLPMLLLAPHAGALLDRVDKRRALITVQLVQAALAGVLALVVLSGAVRLWQVYLLAAAFGIGRTVDSTGRQSFVIDLVGPEYLRNAVTLNSVLSNVARAVGPALAGLLTEAAGVGWTFAINAASYLAVVWVLVTLRRMPSAPDRPTRATEPRALRAALAQVRATPELSIPLSMMAVIGTLTYEFQVTLPLLAKFALHTGASGYGEIASAYGVGAIAGGLATAGTEQVGARSTARAAVVFGALVLTAALAPDLPAAVLLVTAVGFSNVLFLAAANTMVLLAAAPAMRGRVMGLWNVAFQGSTALGGVLVGVIGQYVGARWSLGLGGLAAVVAGLLGCGALARTRTDVRAVRDHRHHNHRHQPADSSATTPSGEHPERFPASPG